MEPHEPSGAPAPSSTPVAPSAAPGTPTPPATVSDNENVAAALHELAGLADRPLAEQPEGFARVHAGLQRALADIDDA